MKAFLYFVKSSHKNVYKNKQQYQHIYASIKWEIIVLLYVRFNIEGKNDE